MGCQRTQLQECLGIEALDVMIGRLKVLENATQQLVVKEKLIICPVVLVSRRSRKKTRTETVQLQSSLMCCPGWLLDIFEVKGIGDTRH